MGGEPVQEEVRSATHSSQSVISQSVSQSRTSLFHLKETMKKDRKKSVSNKK